MLFRSVQGIVVTVSGLMMVVFFVIRSKCKSVLPLIFYGLVSISFGTLSLLGAFQRGPFDFIYKRSVSLRGSYWHAGIEMGMQHPFTGVGMDSYGDWYRRTRSLNAATEMPGPNTVTNAAHNVWLDLFAYGGFPLIICYISILTLGMISIVRIIRRTKHYEPIPVTMIVVWACYHLQSIISINQIGLAIWGWALTGALIGFDYSTANQAHKGIKESSHRSNIATSNKAQANSQVFSPGLVSGIGIVVGFLIAFPPINSDMKWKSALESKDVTKILGTLDSGLMTPNNSNRFAEAAQLFARNNLWDQALLCAQKGVRFNPDSFDAWKVLYSLGNSSKQEKDLAFNNMKRLDPLNPEIKSSK